MGHLRLEAIGWDVLGKGVLTPFHQQGPLGDDEAFEMQKGILQEVGRVRC